MRASRTLLLAALTLVAGALVAPAPARADGETCRGQAATIVGHSGEAVHGTDGDDVIVTNGASETYAGPGDDTICVVGDFEPYVDAGDGDDVVDATSIKSLRNGVRVDLGRGSDTFEGANGRDEVTAGTLHADDGIDHVATGRGKDTLTTGDATPVNHDDVDLGGGNDVLNLLSERNDGSLHGGPGLNRVRLVFSTPRDRVVDDRAGQVRVDGAVAAFWTGFHVSAIDGEQDASVTYLGTEQDDHVEVNEVGLRSADLGSGDDWLWLLRLGDAPRDRIDGGTGHDSVLVYDPEAVDLDLTRDRLSGYRVIDNEYYRAVARTVSLRGSHRADTLSVDGCSVIVRGLGGDDDISWADAGQACRRNTDLRLYGGRGADRLVGSPYDDHLDGGSGVDRVRGREGTDWCRGEFRRSCELP
ncbi:hypothetical protein [Nocardioides sp.]|uniref:hypothetical protein n=1 Tax=Nocardioides sp. TaxID=35761 RepID=UPI0025CC53C9|nr:hypothetical protein [Nocardioides sp.]